MIPSELTLHVVVKISWCIDSSVCYKMFVNSMFDSINMVLQYQSCFRTCRLSANMISAMYVLNSRKLCVTLHATNHDLR